MKTILEWESSQKVNWDYDDGSLKLSILPNAWTLTFLHPAFGE